MKDLEIIVLYWHDAAMQGSVQLSESEAKAIDLMRGWVAGILVGETDDSITLAMDRFDFENGNHESQYRQIHVYPKSGIETIIRKVIKAKKK